VERADFPYLLVGVAAAARRRVRGAIAIGVDAAEITAWPAAQVWRSPVAAPVRRRAEDAAGALADDGRVIVRRSRQQARIASADLIRRIADQIVRSGLADEVVDRLLQTGALDRVVTVVINHPGTEELITSALEDPGMARLVSKVMDSRFVDELTAQLLASEELRLILDYVTRSPELRAALAQQTAGLAGDVAAGVRSRTVVADDAAERFARSLLRRRPRQETR
jgi:hypothetical protein